MRTYIFVTAVYGNITIRAHNRDDAIEAFTGRGYLMTDIEEIR
jgi:hypothetical protein